MSVACAVGWMRVETDMEIYPASEVKLVGSSSY